MKKLVIIACFLIPILAVSQVKNIGTPNIRNFEKSDYRAGTQNWAIAQDNDGFIYFANNDGLLKFDGFHWELIEVPLSLVRSVFVDSKNRIFVGLLYGFGIIRQNETGVYQYNSLVEKVPEEHRNFNDVWKIYEVNGKIVFQSFEKIFIYDNEKIEVINPKKSFHFSFNINGRLLIQETGDALYEVFPGFIDKVPWAERLKNEEIISILEIHNNQLLIGTAQNGLFHYNQGNLSEWKTEVSEFLKTNKLFCATKIKGNHFAFGTILNGVVISDENGRIVQHLNREIGLHNNTILSVFSDRHENLWLGFDNGIGYVEINSPITYITAQGRIGTGYCCQVFDGKLYVGTNQGLFAKPFNNFLQNNEDFKLINNTAGQVWSLKVANNQLICGHNFGTFKINGSNAEKISSEPGAWDYIELKNHPEFLLGGHYNGLVLLKWANNSWVFYKKVKGFSESSRFLMQDDSEYIWMSHGGKGIYKMHLNQAADSVDFHKIYGQNEGLPSNTQNILFGLKGKIYVSTINGVYSYNPIEDSFAEASDINDLFGIKERIKTVKEDTEGNIWFISENESGVLRKNEDFTYTKITSPFQSINNKYVSEFEFIYPLNNDHSFLGIDIGFAHYSSKFPKSYTYNYKSFITKIELNYIDSVIYFPTRPGIEYRFPYKRNNIRIHFTAPFYENLPELRFSYFLENYSDNWSEWTPDIYKEFNNLPFGSYEFKLKAINNYSVESEIDSFRFIILPPWYKTNLAYTIYALLAAILLLTTIFYINLRLKRSKEREKEKHKQELKEREEQFQHQSLITEKEIIKLRNDKLTVEMIHRDKELANQTNSIIQKNKFLMKLNLELKKIQTTTDDSSVASKLSVLKKKIDREIDNEKQNRIFETYFDEVHNDFFDRLKEQHPKLSSKELRLCAYIKMNLSTKEIATLLNISDRGVEISRYRLRKKLDLAREINLSVYLSGI